MKDCRIFYPFIFVIANMTIEVRDGIPIVDNSTRRPKLWKSEGYKVKKLTLLWIDNCHIEYELEKFSTEPYAMESAFYFVRNFESQLHENESWVYDVDCVLLRCTLLR